MAHEQETAKSVRLRLKLSITAAAAGARLAPNTYRIGELDPRSLSMESRLKFEAYLETLRTRAAQEAA